jgi:hypothetical protein
LATHFERRHFQLAECLPTKHKTLRSNPSITETQQQQQQQRRIEEKAFPGIVP